MFYFRNIAFKWDIITKDKYVHFGMESKGRNGSEGKGRYQGGKGRAKEGRQGWGHVRIEPGRQREGGKRPGNRGKGILHISSSHFPKNSQYLINGESDQKSVTNKKIKNLISLRNVESNIMYLQTEKCYSIFSKVTEKLKNLIIS